VKELDLANEFVISEKVHYFIELYNCLFQQKKGIWKFNIQDNCYNKNLPAND
jgi:hypothetical protein